MSFTESLSVPINVGDPNHNDLHTAEREQINLLTEILAGIALCMPDTAIAESFPSAGVSGNVTLTSGNAVGTHIVLPAGQEITGITFVKGSTAATSPTNQWFGLASKTYGLIGVTNNDGSTAWAANTAKRLTLTTPYTPSALDRYYAFCVITATTPGNLAAAGGNAGVNGVTPLKAWSDSAHALTDPASAPGTFTPSAIGQRVWCFVDGE